MLIKLEDAHLQAAASGKETGFDYAGADRLYARAFADYGLDLTILSNTEYAARVRASAICERLITALDGWAFVREKLQLGSGGDLWSVADLADDDAWRPRLRAVVRRWDRTALEELAQEGGAPSNLSANQTLLAISLAQAGSWAMAERLLRQVQAARPGDFWINFQLALTLRQKKSADRAGAIRFVQAALALRPQSPVVHNNLGILLYEKKDVDGAIAESREAIRLKKDFPEAHGNLGNALYDKGDTDGAIAELREAIQLNKDLPEAHNNLGIALEAKGDLDGAIDEYRRAIEIDPKFALPHANLGHLLYAKKEVAGAIAEFRRAIDLDPKFALAHTNLGSALYDNKDVDGAIAEYKKAIDSDPNFALAHYDLAVALDGKQDVDGAIAEYKKAIDINPKYANAHNNLGNDLGAKGNLDEAIAEYKKAIDSYPKHAVAHNGLGVALAAKGDLAGAIAAFHKAIELVPKYANAHNNLRQALVLRKLPAILKGEAQAAGTAERLDLAVVCATPPKKLYAAAARFYAGAFAADPKLAADLQQQHRYNAACSAALAAAGQGEDARQLPDKVQRMLRRQALVWLRDDLALYGKLAEREEPAAKQIVRQLLGHWPEDTDLVSIRDRDALAKLPEAERKDWQKLWADVAETLARAQGKTAPEQKPGVK